MIRTLFMIMMLLSCIIIRAQQIFSLSCTGNIIPDSSFIDSFYVDNNLRLPNVEPYVLQEKICLSERQSNQYEVYLFKYNNWGADPGDVHVVQIKNMNRQILTVRNDLGWSAFNASYTDAGASTTQLVEIINLDDQGYALVLTGFPYASEPRLLTVIVLKKGYAKIVYNKPANIKKTKRGTKHITRYFLQLNTVEYDSNNKPYNEAKMATLTFENGMIYYKE